MMWFMMGPFGGPFGFFGLILFFPLFFGLLRYLRHHLNQDRLPPTPPHRGRDDPERLETAIYRLAGKYAGRLTVSRVVIELDIPPSRAEKILEGMSDNIRVQMNVTDSGTIVYEFPELMD